MAGHLPIGSAGFKYMLADLTFEFIMELEDFKRVPYKGGKLCLLPDDYSMNSEHGKKDSVILCWEPAKSKVYEDSGAYEIHLNRNLNINEVYLVM